MMDKSVFLIYKEFTQAEKITTDSSQEKQTEGALNTPQDSTDKHTPNHTSHQQQQNPHAPPAGMAHSPSQTICNAMKQNHTECVSSHGGAKRIENRDKGAS